MVVKDIKISQRMSIEKIFLECKKQRLSEYTNFFNYIYPRLVHGIKKGFRV